MESTNNQGTPLKSSPRGSTLEEIRNFASGERLQKISIDRYGGVHREYEKPPVRFVPFVRVDSADGQVPVVHDNSEANSLKEELRMLIEMREKKSSEARAQLLKKDIKSKKIDELMEKVKMAKLQNEQLRKLTMKSNELKQKVWRQKEGQQMLMSQLSYEAQETIRLQQKESIVAGREIFLKETFIREKQKKINTIKKQTTGIRQKDQKLNREIEEETQKTQGKLTTIGDLNRDIERITAEVNASTIQLSVLKMQISPCLRVGFSTVSLDPENDRKRILDKNSNTWPRNKTKAMTVNEIRDYLVMQLYPSWKRMLSKMSSEFIGYQQILGYESKEEEEKMLDLTLYLPQKPQNNRTTACKIRSLIVLYSPIEANCSEVMKVAIGLNGLNNGIIKVGDVRIENLEQGSQEIQITYDYLGSQRLRKIEVICLKELTRQGLIRYLPVKDDRVVLLKLQIPLIPSSLGEKLQYEEVYELIRRWK